MGDFDRVNITASVDEHEGRNSKVVYCKTYDSFNDEILLIQSTLTKALSQLKSWGIIFNFHVEVKALPFK